MRTCSAQKDVQPKTQQVIRSETDTHIISFKLRDQCVWRISREALQGGFEEGAPGVRPGTPGWVLQERCCRFGAHRFEGGSGVWPPQPVQVHERHFRNGCPALAHLVISHLHPAPPLSALTYSEFGMWRCPVIWHALHAALYIASVQTSFRLKGGSYAYPSLLNYNFVLIYFTTLS